MIDGVLVTPLKQIYHPRGDVFHAMKCVDPGFEGFGEAYSSSIIGGLVKAWKRHSRMTLNLVCIVGKIHFVLYDGRDGSPTKGEFMEITLSPEDPQLYRRLTIPPGVWMAFVGIDKGKSILLNVANIPHDPSEQVNIPAEESDIVFDFSKIDLSV
ncbi:dTDP-4-dehydrorhamnose 3,5-epimerase family protein [Parabacteroides distasonis]|uniref:dTDP-4-dehydrorhamnose 3,5-epimerase family protein n=1 Tax=Parabacteroides distasonis TaxID=823 RepID=UPI00189EB3F6|nr:dTDP-4-dehydrorhamnose 3,5-epimerase family protein [Parabacteroides distasonis]MDB9150939.1 dTDP-4-dehydrorhamnose 3,5-epimerase family protein [Parabacteroides distasonis]MDB9155449.1 dTDP-4-dehydrorhamnose 3,5-epimerase family protein [Parabacteroides distasonis]MDB9163753.1 dTDP-4-dehydrorhamnose 3,5-epimerase family protein [Parabacteroides distasonis]MDB9168003.1 dTDP-4-dehydrorhamnose 3,5-epimerase family protein [Parabacteroides distasonis]MDB9196896.1 dTDP-4-dehydrorhamnose 3,5-epi